MSGALNYYKDKKGVLNYIPGPYAQEARIHWLKRVLDVQQSVRTHKKTPSDIKDIELISLDELEEIRRIWVENKREIEDFLPEIYEEIIGEKYPGRQRYTSSPFSKDSLEVLRSCCENDLQYQMLRNLLDIENQYRAKGKRRGVFADLKNQANKDAFSDAKEALNVLVDREKLEIESKGEDNLIPVEEI